MPLPSYIGDHKSVVSESSRHLTHTSTLPPPPYIGIAAFSILHNDWFKEYARRGFQGVFPVPRKEKKRVAGE
jgi:hypothetical protein